MPIIVVFIREQIEIELQPCFFLEHTTNIEYFVQRNSIQYTFSIYFLTNFL